MRYLFTVILFTMVSQTLSQEVYRTFNTVSFGGYEDYALINKYEDTVVSFYRVNWKKVQFDTDFNTYFMVKRGKNLYLFDSNMKDTLAALIKRKELHDYRNGKRYRMIGTASSFLFFDSEKDCLEFKSKIYFTLRGYKITVETKFTDFQAVPIIFAWYKIIMAIPLTGNDYHFPERNDYFNERGDLYRR